MVVNLLSIQVKEDSKMLTANYKDGIIRDGSSVGSGSVLGNLKDGVIRKGNSPYPGNGDAQGNVKNDVIRKGNSPYPGNGDAILNIKGGVVRAGTSPYPGNGDQKGAVTDFSIKGMDRELDSEMVAAYHFLVKKIV